jgi:hypothetical protein
VETVKVERFVTICGTQIKAAEKMGISQGRLANWMRRHPGDYEVLFTRDNEVLKVMRRVRR